MILRRHLKNLYRQAFFSRFGVKHGERCGWAGKRPFFSNEGRILLGNDVVFRGVPDQIRLITTGTGEVNIGNRVFLNTGVEIFSNVNVTIGDGTLVGDDCYILDSSFHAVHHDEAPVSKPVTIGKNVWLCAKAIILPGVTIGDHSVVAAGSVVFDDIPKSEVWRGNPAKFYKSVRSFEGFERK